jgi:hypothetical protein
MSPYTCYVLCYELLIGEVREGEHSMFLFRHFERR